LDLDVPVVQERVLKRIQLRPFLPINIVSHSSGTGVHGPGALYKKILFPVKGPLLSLLSSNGRPYLAAIPVNGIMFVYFARIKHS
jgi:hypothetical protein